MSFLKAQVSFPSNLASIFSAIKHNFYVLFQLKIIYFGQRGQLKRKFFQVFASKFVKFLMSILNWQVNSSSNLASFFIAMTHNSSVNLSSYIIYFGQKDPIKVPILTLSSALPAGTRRNNVRFWLFWSGRWITLSLLRPKTNIVTASCFRRRFSKLTLTLQQCRNSDVIFLKKF